LYKIPANTLFLGKNLFFVPECHSTNTLLADLAQKTNPIEGTLLITAKQTKGRGQRGNGWEAEPNQNLTFSFLVKPSFLAVADQFKLTMTVSLAVADYLCDRNLDSVKIKWPNDVMVNGKKISGILIENTLSGSQLQQCVVGIGLNVNQTVFSIESATSMKLITDDEFALDYELNFLLEKLEGRYLQLRAGKFAELERNYLDMLYWKGEEHLFLVGGDTRMGAIEGVDRIGKLKVRMGDETHFFGLKEIQFIK